MENGQSVEEPMDRINPVDFLDRFRQSPEMQRAVALRFEEAHKRNPDITEGEVAEGYFNRTEARPTFWRFYRGFKRDELGGKNPAFDLSQLPEDFQTALHAYFDQIRRNSTLQGDAARAGELTRTQLHNDAASLLVEYHVAPTFTFGRIMVHLMAVSEGLDKEDPDREDKKNAAPRRYGRA